MRGQRGHDTRWHAQLPTSFLSMADLTTERGVDPQATRVIDVLGLSFDILSMGLCTTRHCKTSGRLVQELNVCAVVHATRGWSA